MGGVGQIIRAKTMAELKKAVEKHIKEAESMGLGPVQGGWDPKAVVKTKDGYETVVLLHT